jgi:hypothetical protein
VEAVRGRLCDQGDLTEVDALVAYLGRVQEVLVVVGERQRCEEARPRPGGVGQHLADARVDGRRIVDEALQLRGGAVVPQLQPAIVACEGGGTQPRVVGRYAKVLTPQCDPQRVHERGLSEAGRGVVEDQDVQLVIAVDPEQRLQDLELIKRGAIEVRRADRRPLAVDHRRLGVQVVRHDHRLRLMVGRRWADLRPGGEHAEAAARRAGFAADAPEQAGLPGRVERDVGDDVQHQDDLEVRAPRIGERGDERVTDRRVGEVLVLDVDVLGCLLDGPQVGLEDALFSLVKSGESVDVDRAGELRGGQVLSVPGRSDLGRRVEGRHGVRRLAVLVPVQHELLLEVGHQRPAHADADVVHRDRLARA